MGQENLKASAWPKALWLVPDAIHAESYWVDPVAYATHIRDFIAPYFSN